MRVGESSPNESSTRWENETDQFPASYSSCELEFREFRIKAAKKLGKP